MVTLFRWTLLKLCMSVWGCHRRPAKRKSLHGWLDSINCSAGEMLMKIVENNCWPLKSSWRISDRISSTSLKLSTGSWQEGQNKLWFLWYFPKCLLCQCGWSSCYNSHKHAYLRDLCSLALSPKSSFNIRFCFLEFHFAFMFAMTWFAHITVVSMFLEKCCVFVHASISIISIAVDS